MTTDLHLVWGACWDWATVRRNLKFLGVTRYANFCDVRDGDAEKIANQVRGLGYVVEVEPGERVGYLKNTTVLRISDLP